MQANFVKLHCLVTVHRLPHHNHFTVPFPGPLCEPVPENFWTLWCKGRLTEADTLTIQLGTTSSRLTSADLHHPPFFTGRMPFLPPNHPTVSKHRRQLAHSDYGKDASVLFNGVTSPALSPYHLHHLCATTITVHVLLCFLSLKLHVSVITFYLSARYFLCKFLVLQITTLSSQVLPDITRR